MPRALLAALFLLLLLARLDAAEQPTPLLSDDNPVDWLFVYKFNTRASR